MVNRFSAIFFLVVVCFSAISAAELHGIVRGAAGQPLDGAKITLEKSKQQVTSASDGTFMFNVGIPLRSTLPRHHAPVILKGEAFRLELSGSIATSISVFNLQGQKVAETHIPGTSETQFVRIQPPGRGMYVYTVSSISSKSGLAEISTDHFYKTASTGVYEDILRVDMYGYITSQRTVSIPDTSLITIKMIACIDSVTDFDGNVYHAVQIGSNVWTVENFRSTRYRNGAEIRINPNYGTWGMWTEGLYCYYNNIYDSLFRKSYGALYNWYAVNNASGFAPNGWHVPSDTEWIELKTFLMNNEKYSWDGTKEENKIAKSLCAMAGWSTSSVPGAVGNDPRTNNITGFSAQGGGYRSDLADFWYLDKGSYWWCSNRKDSTAYMFFMTFDRSSLEYSTRKKNFGLSVRLVRDR